MRILLAFAPFLTFALLERRPPAEGGRVNPGNYPCLALRSRPMTRSSSSEVGGIA
jgi:hypothetical protein